MPDFEAGRSSLLESRTELAATNAQLEQRTRHIETVLESVPSSVLSLDAARQILNAKLEVLKAQTDAQMHAEILSWSRSQGLFAGLALEGATLRQDQNDNRKLYGRKLENRKIVTSGMAAPKAAARLLHLLNKYSASERKNVSQVIR